ncbi:MAG: methyltransferase domain-containing protein [Candidatus Sungbacteria bacterium]|nr:methyltransferase domain-containing protein [Candidatus Sungbacteria bacterium]
MLTVSQTFLSPEKIVKHLKLEEGDHVADFGAGHGFFTVPMSRIVGGDGKIYAIDIQKSTLDIIRTKAKIEHLLNIEPVWGNLEQIGGSKLKDGFVDLVLIANILFQAEDKFTLLREAYRILRHNGRLAIIEWDASETKLGPSPDVRLPPDQTKSMVLQSGFSFDREIPAGAHHFGLMFIKK